MSLSKSRFVIILREGVEDVGSVFIIFKETFIPSNKTK